MILNRNSVFLDVMQGAVVRTDVSEERVDSIIRVIIATSSGLHYVPVNNTH
jgi:hypothetical protein